MTGAGLAAIATGWAALFDEIRDPDAIGKRGEALFAVAARLLGATDARLGEAGRWFALGDAARRRLSPVIEVPEARLRFARSLRPLTGLARLAVRDLRHGEPFEMEASPARAAALLRHRWSGTV